MNFFNKLGTGVYNAPVLNQMEQDNELKLCWRLAELENKLGYNINKKVLKTLALKRLLDCYDNQELINIMDHYKLLKEE